MVTLAGQSLQRHIENRDVSAVTHIISNGTINLDERDDNGQTFLMTAAQQGNLEVVKHLLSCDVDVNAVDNDNWTALLNAAKEGYADVLSELLDNSANIEHKDLGCWTALTWACYKGRTECAILLLEKGANPNVKGDHHMSCLTWAAGRGHLEIVKALLHHGAKVNTADKYGTTPLIWASRKGHVDIVETLLDEGANVDNAGMNSWTALYVAAKGGYADCVRAILSCGPNVNAVDKDGFTALTVAAKEGHMDIVYNLLLKGAYVNLPDRYGDSIMIHAVKGGHLEIVQALLEKCADVDVAGVDGKTAMYWAVEKNHNDIGKAILENDPTLEIQTKDGDTVLSKAVRCRNNEIVDILLKKGARVSTADKRGDTPLHIAVRGRSKRITETLLRNPKDSRLLYRPNKGGETPYQLDSQHQKSILTQIFGTRQLNAEESIAGYDLYSSTIADVLSEPTLTTPITVGFYAKWGSGKSFLIDSLQKEMRSFTQQKSDPLFSFSWLQFFITFLIGCVIGLIFTFTIRWYVGLAVGGGVFIILYVLLGFVWFGTFKRNWNGAYKISTYLAEKLQYFQLLLQIIFCNQPKKPPNETAGVRFLFTDNARLASVVGEKSITAMIATLCDSLDQEYGMLVTRLFRVFKPGKAAEHGLFKSFCCIPYFVMVIFVVLCIVAAIILLLIFGIQNIYDRKYTAVDSILIALAIIVGVALIGNSYTWGRMVVSLLISQQKRVQRIGRHIESLKMEGFMQKLKHEVELMGQMVKCMDSFTNHHTRLVVIVDGLDSCEQDKLLQVLDTVHMLFGEAHSPFITVLAVDPHVVIKGIEHNLHGFFRDTSINGHDYLRNIVHLPFFLQIQNAPLSPNKHRASTRSDHTGENRSGRILNRTDSVMSSTSEISDGPKKGKHKSSVKARGGSSLQRQPSTMDLSKSLSKNSYFTDVNPRNLRRLMNIIAVTARILRACNIDFNWYRLMAWINVTEQWPYRLSWIILYVEDSENIDDLITLKQIYEKVSNKMPASKEVEPLLEIDRNPRKLEVFLGSHSPALNVGDLRKFLPCTINVDPYLRKLIREMQQAAETANEIAAVYNPMNPPEQNMLPWYGQNRPPSRLDVMNSTSPRSTPINRRGSVSNAAFMPLPHSQMFMMHSMMQGMMGYQSPQMMNVSRSSPRFQVKGVNQDVRLSSLSVEGVCKVLSKLEGLNIRKLDEYCTTLHRSNINGMVLLNCNLDDLKSEMKMNFGDWELFRNVVQTLREREAAKGHDSATPNAYEGGASPELQGPYVNFTDGNVGVENASKLQMPIPKYPDPNQRIQRRSVSAEATRLESVGEVSSTSSAGTVSQIPSIIKRKSVTPPGDIRYRYSPGYAMGENNRHLDQSTSPVRPFLKKQDSFVDETLFESELLYKRMARMGIEDDSREDEDVFERVHDQENSVREMTYSNAPDQLQLTRPQSRKAHRSPTPKMDRVAYVAGEDNVNIEEAIKEGRESNSSSLSRQEKGVSFYSEECDEAPLLSNKKSKFPKALARSFEKLSKSPSKETASKEKSGSPNKGLYVKTSTEESDKPHMKDYPPEIIKVDIDVSSSHAKPPIPSGKSDLVPMTKLRNSPEAKLDYRSAASSLSSSLNGSSTKVYDERTNESVGSMRDVDNLSPPFMSDRLVGNRSGRSSHRNSGRFNDRDLEITTNPGSIQATELRNAIIHAQETQVQSGHGSPDQQHVSAFKVVSSASSSHAPSECSSVIGLSREGSVESVKLTSMKKYDIAISTSPPKVAQQERSSSPRQESRKSSTSRPGFSVEKRKSFSSAEGLYAKPPDVEYSVNKTHTGTDKDADNEEVIQL